MSHRPSIRTILALSLLAVCAIGAPGGQARSAATSYDQTVLANAPAAYWRLGETSGTAAVDTSGKGNGGSYSGGVTLASAGLINDPNTAATFDGNDDRMYFNDSASLSPTAAISVEAWVRPTVVPTAAGSGWHLFAKWNTALLYIQGGASPKFVFTLYNSATASYGPYAASTTTVAAGSTYHVVGTYDGASLRIYVNGGLQATVARSGAVYDSTFGGVLAGGGWGTLPSPAFKGRLDEIAIYSSALSASTVQQHYTAGTTAAFTVSSSITNGSTLAGPVSWEATPSRSASKVEFYIDGALRWTESIAPFVFNGDGMQLDTRTLSDGSHLLKAIATATDGSKAEASSTVTVANRRAAPPSGTSSAGRVLYMAPKAGGSDGQFHRQLDLGAAAVDARPLAESGGGRWRLVGLETVVVPERVGVRGFLCDLQPVDPRHAAPRMDPQGCRRQEALHPVGMLGRNLSPVRSRHRQSRASAGLHQPLQGPDRQGVQGHFRRRCEHGHHSRATAQASGSPRSTRAPVPPMTDAAWKSYFAELHGAAARRRSRRLEITHNAVWFSGGGQHDATQPDIVREIKAADFVNLERGFLDGGITGGTGTWSVYAFMRFIDNVHSYGRHVVLQSYANDTTTAEYNLAGYFLINDGHDYVSSTLGSLPVQLVERLRHRPRRRHKRPLPVERRLAQGLHPWVRPPERTRRHHQDTRARRLIQEPRRHVRHQCDA